jgi:alpha-ribazole phosphatase
MSSPSILYLLRHGQIAGHEERRLIGQMDVPLSAKGIEQIRWWKEQWAHLSFDRILCSDLSRSRSSAEILAELVDGPVETVPELREITLGEWEGLTAEEIGTRYPSEWDERGKDLEKYRPPGGESFSDLSARTVPVFETAAQAGGRVLIVGHAAVNRVILCHILGVPLSNVFRLGQDYAALNIIVSRNGTWCVDLLNRSPDGF